MLSHAAQEKIFKRYSNKTIKKSIDSNFSFEYLAEQFIDKIENIEEFSNVVYIDICDFSAKVSDYSPVQVKKYLDEYYSSTMRFIKEYNGQIDKLMGDGIIVVFSKIFKQIVSGIEASNNAFLCCLEILHELSGTEFEAKASIGSGKLFYCKTGVEQIYEEFTAVGYPYTVAYRLENIADNNQILLMRNTALSKRIEKNEKNLVSICTQEEFIENLKGVNCDRIHKIQLRPLLA